MSETNPLPIHMQILMLRQTMALQRQLIYQRTDSKKDMDQFPRSLSMRVLQQQLTSASPWLLALQNKFGGKESALLWSVAVTLGQHWLQSKGKNQQ